MPRSPDCARTSLDQDLAMPCYIILENGKIMRLRNHAAVLRRHKFKEKDPHEFFYSESMLFSPWYSEEELFHSDPENCQALYQKMDMNPEVVDGRKLSKIDTVQRKLFPHLIDVTEGREMVEKFEYDQQLRIGDDIDREGEQNHQDDDELGFEDADEYSGFHPGDLTENSEDNAGEVSTPDETYNWSSEVRAQSGLRGKRKWPLLTVLFSPLSLLSLSLLLFSQKEAFLIKLFKQKLERVQS